MFVQRNQTYSVLQQLWNMAMERALRRAESTVQVSPSFKLNIKFEYIDVNKE